MTRHLQLVGGGQSPAPASYVDTLPDRVLVEHRATVSLTVDVASGEITRIQVQALPDDTRVFDAETWNDLPLEHPDVKAFINAFDPHKAHQPESIEWLDPEEYIA